MKRALFLGGAAFTVLNGCGGRHALEALPQVARDERAREVTATVKNGAALMPVAPANVIANPIIGEAWGYAGSQAPPKWMFAQGQTLQIQLEKPLFEVIGTSAGGDGKKTFKLPNPGFPMIVAVDGTFVTSPRQLSGMGRDLSPAASLGKGATPSRRHPVEKKPATFFVAERTPYGRVQYLSPGEDAVLDGIRHGARDAGIAVLSQSNRTLLDSSVSDVVSGTLEASDAIRRLAGALGDDEARALLAVNDAMIRKTSREWAGTTHENPRLEAARFMFSVAFSPEQTRYVMARESA